MSFEPKGGLKGLSEGFGVWEVAALEVVVRYDLDFLNNILVVYACEMSH